MDLRSVDRLVALARSGKDGAWPLPQEEPILKAINTWIALREGDKDTLKRVAGWPAEKPYRVDPLPERISEAWSSYLFGEDPAVRPFAESDAALLEDLIERDFPSELQRAAGLAVSEGEVWSRVYVDPSIAARPLLEWHSRANVLPLYVGPRLVAAALITELPDPQGNERVTFRLLECHVAGGVVNVLFKGRPDKLGDPVDLGAHPLTAGAGGAVPLAPTWDHGLPRMLMDRVPNRLRRDRRVGISDYAGVLDFLLDLNEAAAIGAQNARLTARKRAVVSRSALGTAEHESDLGNSNALQPPRPRFDSTEEVFIEDPLDAELGRGATNPVRILEYGFDAEALIRWHRHLVEGALTRVGLAVQYVGVQAGDEGYAMSGTALRLRLIPTDATGRAKGRYWDDALPRILSTMAALDALGQPAGGFGRGWRAPLELPSVERRTGLPRDEVEEAGRHATLVGASVESKRQAVIDLHPDWTEEQVEEELDRIAESSPSPLGSMLPRP